MQASTLTVMIKRNLDMSFEVHIFTPEKELKGIVKNDSITHSNFPESPISSAHELALYTIISDYTQKQMSATYRTALTNFKGWTHADSEIEYPPNSLPEGFIPFYTMHIDDAAEEHNQKQIVLMTQDKMRICIITPIVKISEQVFEQGQKTGCIHMSQLYFKDQLISIAIASTM